MASFRKLLLLSAFVASTVAGPVPNNERCARYCTVESDLSLSPGSTYTYDYETTTVTTVQGASDKTQIQMTAQVDIEVLSKCDLALRLRGVTLKLSDPESPDYLVSLRGAREFARTIEKHILRFSFQNGLVEHVCPGENVPDWVTNIHKGVLSAFQTYNVKPEWTTRIPEVDILGKCTAEYHSLGRNWQGAHTIRKLKDLNFCTEREHAESFLQGTQFSNEFNIQSMPLVKGNQECEQVISDSFLQTSTCNEKLVFRPFSNSGNGVVTTVSQKLIFAATSERKFTGKVYQTSTETLLYKHFSEEASSAKIEEETEKALKELCDASKTDISISVPRKFSAFVYKLKKLSLKSLKAFYQKSANICPENTKARKFFMDAIPLVSTSDSARFMYEMISTKSISDSEISFWLTSLAFITDTTPEIISTFTPLLDGRFNQAILGVSALIRNYCQNKDCSNVREVEAAVGKLAQNVGMHKHEIISLKAIGNIGYMFKHSEMIETIYKFPQRSIEVRLAAIEAYRRVSCDISREELMKTYSNYNEDTEIRIAAYLAVMRCPSVPVIEQVKEVMMGEKINHVGSFVWTHLTALSKTKHPERQTIRNIVSTLYLMNKFASDARKFSTAHEAHYFLESIDSGIHTDSHMIFTTDSYLPRTAMFNLTVDIFGKSCNLFQIDGRLEGLEHVVESFFGPGGYFPQKNIAKILREKRSVDNNKLNLIDSQFGKHLKTPQEPYGSVDVKVFGTSMWYQQFKNTDDGPDINLLDIVTKLAEENEKEYSRSFMFLDTTFTIPMTSGLPLKIALNGTASVGLKIGGKFNVKNFEHVDVQGHIEPSGAIEIAGLLTVDAGHVARSGMRIISTMHSSSVLDGKVLVRNGEVVKAQLNMPRDRIDVFNIQSKMFIVHGNEEREKVSDKKEGTHMQSCTGRTISKILGVKFCSELELPPYRPNAPLQPLSGPASFNLFIEKTDPTLKSYNFDAQWRTEMKNGAFVKHGMLAINTPQSKVDRDVNMELYVSQADQTATLKIKTPVKKLGVNAKLVDTNSQKKLDFSVNVDDKDYFSLQSELGINNAKNSVSYTPSLEIRIPSKRLIAITGSADLRYGQKYTGQLQIEDLTEKPILAKGSFEVGKRNRYDIEASLTSFPLDGTVKGFTQFGDNLSSRFIADYRILEGKMNKLSVVGKMRNLSASALTKYNGALNIQASALPEWNTELVFETMKTTGHIENTVQVSLGDGARSRVHTIKLQEILRYEGNLMHNKVDGSLKLQYAEKNIDYGISVKHENTDHSLKNNLEIQYDTNKQISTDVQLKRSTGDFLSVAGDVKLTYPGRETGLQAELVQSSNKEYRGTASCQWQRGRQASVVLHYKDKCEGSRMKYEIDGNMNLSGSSPVAFGTIVAYHRGEFTGSAELSRGVDKYHAKADISAGNGLNHRMAGQLVLKNGVYGIDAAINNVKDRLNGNVELRMPNSHKVTAKLESRMGDVLKFGSFETYWDAERDTSKRFVVNGELHKQADGYDGKVVMQIRRRTVKGALSTSLQGSILSSLFKTNNKIELELSPTEKYTGILSTNVILGRSRQQLGSHIEVTTPYYGFENITLSVNHLYTNQQWSSELSSLLPWGNDITMSTNGKYAFARGSSNIETSGRILTSFKGFEEMSATITHVHDARELSNKAEVKWGLGKRIFYQVNGVKQLSSLRGSMKLNTPFSYLNDISGEINHVHSSDNYKTKGELQWAPSKRIAFTTEGTHELTGRRRICTINFEGSSPFRGYETTAAKILYNNDGIAINTDVEATWNRNKITTSLSTSKRIQMYNKNLEGKFSFTSPFRNYENVQISTSLEMNENSYKINVDTQLPHKSTASINSQGKLVDWNDMEVNAVVIGHFPRYMDVQRASIDFVHKLQNAKLRSTLDASYGNERLTVVLIGLTESAYNSRNSEFSATINTPFKNFEELKADFAHNQRGYEYFSKLQMSKNKLSGSLTHKLSIRDALNFDTTLELTSTSSLPNGKISIVQANSGRQLEHTSFVQWDKNNKIHLNAQYLDKTFLKEALVKITTPFRGYKDLEFKASTERQDREHKGALSFVWDRRNKMTLSADIKYYRYEILDAQIEFTSPFKGYEFYSTVLKYDLTAPQKEAEASFLWDVANRKAVVAKGKFLYSNRLVSLDMSLTTPFDDFESVTFLAKYEINTPTRNVNIMYERGWRRINFIGKTVLRSNEAEITVNFNSPYRSLTELSASAKYNKIRNGMKGEVNAQWNKQNNYKAAAQYELKETSVKGSIEVNTPIRNYEKLAFDVSGSSLNSRMNSEVSFGWGNDRRILLNANVYNGKSEGEFDARLLSPFAACSDLSVKTTYKHRSGQCEADLQVTINRNNVYGGSVEVKHGGSHLAEIQVIIDTPVSPLKGVQFDLTTDLDSDLFKVMSTLKWEGKQAEIEIQLNKRSGQFYEAKLKLNTPFEGLKVLSFDSSLRNDKNKFVDGRLTIVTPFEYLSNFDAYAKYKSEDSGDSIDLKFNTPNKNLNILGKLSNSQFKPFIASLDVEAPFTSFKSVSTNLELNILKWNNAKAKFNMNSLKFKHQLGLEILQDSSSLNLKMTADSTAIPSKVASITITADYKDSSRISTEASLEMFGKVHYMNGQYKYNGKNLETEIKMESSILPKGEAKIIAKLNRRRNDRVLDGEVNFSYASSVHQATAKYENKGNQVSGNVKVDSDLLSFSTLESEAKYINSNGRDMEVSFSVSTPYSSHAITSSLKNYEGEKIVQLKIDCPMVSFLNPFTITSTLRHEGYSAMDISLSVSTPEKEVRVAGNMKNEGWQNTEGFLTINTPFESLKMVRLDGRFRNDKFQNIDCSFQIETSNSNFPSLGVTSKLSRTEGSEEMSLMLKLPIQKYRSVQLLGNVHYNTDYSSADSRITFTLPRSKYVIYGQYGVSQSRISGRGEVELNNEKWSATGRLERNSAKKDIAVSISTPSSRTYTVGGAYGNSGNRQHLAMTYSNPSNERYTWNSTLNIENPQSFSFDFQAETPFYSYKTMQGSVQLQSNSNSFSYNAEYTKNGRRGFVKVFHRNQRDGLKGSIQMGCPYTKVRDIKLSYSRVKKYTNIEDSIELDYNREKQFKMEVILFGEKSSHFVLDAPVLSLTVTADSKKISYGREINFKSMYFSRVVSFRTSHQWDSRQIVHDAAFTWDERAEKRISYDFKLAKTETGTELWSRLDTPLRSFMLKGNFTESTRVSSGGIDFFWDAARSMEKHMAVGVIQTNIMTNTQNSHKLDIVVEHPKLSKDIVLSNTITYLSKAFHVKSELQYSRERQHNLVMEIKGDDLSRSSRDRHYKGEFVLKHPATRMDIRANVEAMNSKLESSAYLRLNSLDRHQAQNVREIKAKIKKLQQEIEIMMRSNEDQMKVTGNVQNRNDEYDVHLERETNEQTDMTYHVKFSKRNRALDVKIMNAENTGVQIEASFPKESANLKISHSKKGNQVTDASMLLGLEGSKILISKINWRPKLWEDIRITTGENLRSLIANNRARYDRWALSFAEEVSTRVSLMSRSIADLLSPFVDDLKNGVNEIGHDLETAKDSMWRMYYRNEFYMRDIVAEVDTVKRIARDVSNGLALGCEVLYNITVEKVENAYYSVYYACLDLCEYMQNLHSDLMWKLERALHSAKRYSKRVLCKTMDKINAAASESYRRLQQWADRMILKFDKWLRSYAPCIIDGYYYTKNVADKIRYSINEMTDCFVSNRYYIALKNYGCSVANTFKALYDYEYAESVQAFLNRVYDNNFIESIVNHPSIDRVSEAANSALRKSVEVYYNLGMDVAVSHAADSASNYLKTLAYNSAQEYLSEFYQTKAGAKYNFEPKRGHIALELTLPAERNSLLEVFDYESYPEYKKLMNVNSLALEYYDDFCIWDLYYKFVKYFTPSYWMPSFSGHALISGNQHFITFDKLSYDFAGRCSYLLARDFVDGNFTAIVNYGTEDHMRRSLTLLIDGRKVDIGNDYKITMDNNKAELPIQIGKTKMIREGANIRVENERKGYSVICNFVHNYCSVSLSGFYFGRTGGLFGTFNYEPSLDMMSPQRYIMGDIESFTKSWEVGQTVCTSSENFATLPSNDYRVQKKCRDLFQKSTSEFRACFKQVNPETYLKMCINDLSAVHENDHNDAICQSSAAYFIECKMEGVPLKMPKQCVRCEKQDGSYMTEGDAMQFPRDGTVTAADVVFLVEEKQCNKDRVRYLSKLADVIENNFRQKGYRDVRYSVVGFGGDEIHAEPHVHTMDGRESGPLRSLESAFQSLEYGNGPVNILEAMRFAAGLTYRPGTTKSFILVKCSTCKSEEVRAEYGEMLRTLLDGDITLHILMEQKYEMKVPVKSSKARRVIGVDKKFAYTLKDVKDNSLSGDGDLLAQLRLPKDVCIPLAFEVNGSSFDSQFLSETKKNTNKKFMDVLARLVVRSSSMGTTDWGMCCECLATEDGVGKSTCQRCVSEEMASMISADTSGIRNKISKSETSSRRVRKHKERRNGQ
ncbi:vitellogenin [Trichonephila clavata]|uniref:Vitellogenin n=1 Tax=Trichonephila clavata TaxID=2740835 RepID=A0A8X6I532_TRICU|nr:vitellogenin [Trichonephila clavata]